MHSSWISIKSLDVHKQHENGPIECSIPNEYCVKWPLKHEWASISGFWMQSFAKQIRIEEIKTTTKETDRIDQNVNNNEIRFSSPKLFIQKEKKKKRIRIVTQNRAFVYSVFLFSLRCSMAWKINIPFSYVSIVRDGQMFVHFKESLASSLTQKFISVFLYFSNQFSQFTLDCE